MSTNSSNKNGLVAVIVILAIAGGAYYFFVGSKKSQSYYAQIITKLGGSNDYSFLLTADEGYVKNWAIALKAGEKTFEFNGKNYNSSGGKAVA